MSLARLLCLLAALLLSALARAAEPAAVSFYECLPCPAPPVLDGKLDDPCWQSLPLMDQFYRYWSPVPRPPPLHTAARLCHDAAGLYLGVTMYEERLDAVRAAITGRDDPEMWQDDCVEIMIDPAGTGTGYYKFTTNLLGARYDEKTTNMVNDAGYNVEGWQVRTSRGTGAWYLECFLPWSDLQQQPAPGDIWSFDLVRYGYSSGGFLGVSWSLGGSYAAPAKFGHLGFGPFAPYSADTLRRLAPVLRRTKGDYFRLLVPGLALTCERGQWRRENLRRWLQEALKQADAELDAARSSLAEAPPGATVAPLHAELVEITGTLADLRAEARGKVLPGAAAVAYDQARTLQRRLRELRYDALLQGLTAQY